MKPLTIKYRPVPIMPFFLSVSRSFPERWEEISEKQLKAFELFSSGGMEDNKFISIMFGLSEHIVRRLSGFEKYSILDCLNFMKCTEAYLNYVSIRGMAVSIRPDQLRSPLDLFIKNQLKGAEK